MKTDDLIRAMTADHSGSAASLERRFATMIVPGLLLALALFALTLGPRPDFASAVGDARFVFKFVVTLLLAWCSALLVWRLARPGARMSLQAAALATVPAVLLLGVLMELIAVPRPLWAAKLVGQNAVVCLMSIPLFALPMLIAALLALRAGAPVMPGVTGAVAGLFAGALGAAIYAAHCPDDSPLFIAAWYSIAIALVAAVGAAAGRWVLRW
ncbi:MAG: hypothetical protein QOG83_226 [Alphaproteobacteria bacterium]|nr:hypothetical protein [Alphaproteobacteria bacterium]